MIQESNYYKFLMKVIAFVFRIAMIRIQIAQVQLKVVIHYRLIIVPRIKANLH